MTSRQRSLLLWSQFFFFFSGATGLIYQVLWTRRLTLTFGHTVLAVSTVLTAYMAGLALGSLVAGRWTDRPRQGHRFLADYGYLEGFVGVWALATLPLLNLSETFYVKVAASGTTGAVLHLACFVAAALVLIPPTTAMGATVPILARLLIQQPGDVGRILSRLYGLNTLGALFGAALGGFVLLPAIGLTASMVLAALVNFAIAAGAVYKSRQYSPESTLEPEAKKKIEDEPPAESETPEGWLIPLTFAAAGGASMAFQVSWNRSICLAIGSSIYAFSTILVTFLGGLALGSLLYPKIFKDRVPNLGHLALLYLLIAVAGAATVLFIPLLPIGFQALFPLAEGSFTLVLLVDVLLVSALLLLPTLLMGLGFPLATAVYTQALERLGRSVGEIYGANTVGCILGAFFTGFLLVPLIGAQWSLKLACLLYLGNAVLLAVILSRSQRLKLNLVSALCAVMICLLPNWDTGVLSAGVAIYSRVNQTEVVSEFRRPAFYLDGLSCVVSLHLAGENWERPFMRVNGKVDASINPLDLLTQYLLGYIPTLLHPQPKRVGIIGLGGGFTAEAVANCPGVESIEVAELEPAVVTLSEQWKPFNNRVLEDPRVRVHVNDGRTFVLAAQEKFDVLISEPSNPWIAGIGNLFTRDFYQRARNRLNDDGVMCQWFNLYAVSTEDMKMVVRGFYDVFPEGHLWQASGGDLVMIGSNKPAPFDLARVREAWKGNPEIQRHFFEMYLHHPEGIAGHYLMNREEALKMTGSGPFNTDDRPLLEFSAPFSLYGRDSVKENTTLLWAAAQVDYPPEMADADAEAKLRSIFGILNRRQLGYAERALDAFSGPQADLNLLKGQLQLLLAVLHKDDSYREKARKIFEQNLSDSPEESGLTASIWADLEYSAKNWEKAGELYLIALKAPPPGGSAHILRHLGQSLARLDRHEEAIPHLLESAKLTPAKSTALAVAGGAFIDLNENERAMMVLGEALMRNPFDPVALQNMSFALFNAGRPRASEEALLQFLQLIPQFAPAWEKLGRCRMVLGDKSGATAAFREALRLDPGNEKALEAMKEL